MKKTKMYAKKSLSLFMAVMMLLTCWVWVAPEHEHASAATETLTYSIQQLYSTYLTESSGAKFIDGKFTHDNNPDPKDGLYVNVLYSPAYTNTNIYTGPAENKGTVISQKTDGFLGIGNYKTTLDVIWHHAETVMLNDGLKTPQTGVMLTTDPNCEGGDGSSTVHRAWMTNTNLAHPYYWYGICGANLDFTWAMDQGTQLNYLSSNSDNQKRITRKNSDTVPVYANIIKYTGAMSDSTYIENILPSFSLYAENDKGNKTISATSNKYIRIVNYVPLKNTITAAKNYIKEKFVDANGNFMSETDYKKIYTSASLAELAKLANALVAAKPDTTYFDGNNKCLYNEYAADAKEAVDAWNKFIKDGGLKYIYTITFENASGVVVGTFPADQDSKVNLQTLSKDLPTSTLSYNDEYHQTYRWKVDANDVTVKSDMTVYEEIYEKINHEKVYTNNVGTDTHTVTCKNCNYNVVLDHVKGNKKGDVPGEGPTCGAPGKVEYYCLYCIGGTKIFTDPATGDHLEEHYVRKEDTYVPPECETPGFKTYIYECGDCGQVIEGKVDIEEISPAGHDYSEEAGGSSVTYAPTCLTDGYTIKTCHCGHQERIEGDPALGHIEGEAVKEKIVEATCTTPGSYESVVYCTREGCGMELSRKAETVEPLGHDIVIDKAVAPTCTETGLTEGQHCSRCEDEDVTVQQEVRPALGHKPGDVQIENYKAATCEKDGYYEEVVYCTREGCGTEISRTPVEIEATGEHVFVYTSNGNGTHTGTCGCGATENVNQPCSGGEATCVKLAECTVCGGEYGELNENNHDKDAVTKIPEKTPTCQVEGHEAYDFCNDCDKNVTEIVTIPTVDHKYGPWVSNGDGTHTKTCTTCVAANGEISKVSDKCYGGEATCTKQAVCEGCNTAYGELLPHEYTAETVHSSYLATEATCTQQATYYYSCKACGASSKGTADEKTFKHGDLLPHVFTNEGRKTEDYLHTAKTCTSYAKYYHSCENCEAKGTTTFRDVAGGFAPHNYTATQKEIYAETSATCTTGGRYYYSCSACGASCKDDATVENKLFDGEALGHVYRVERVVVSAATCNTPGKYYNKQTCVRCHETTGDETNLIEIPATGKHTFPAEWDETASYPATCGKDGLNIKYCTTCNTATVTEKIPATGIHDYEGVEWEVTTPATCNKMGTQVRECKNCEHPETQSIPVVGHTWTEHNAYDRLKTPATCVSKAVYYKHCATCGMTLEGDKALNGTAHTYTWGDVDANAHNFGGERKYDEEKLVYYYECLNGCGARSESACEFVTIPENATDVQIIELANKVIRESTCKTPGQVEFWCKKCEAGTHVKVVDLKNVDPANHEGEASTVIGAIDALCNREGYTGDVYYDCCPDVMAKKGEKISTEYALNHGDIVTVPAAPATCVADGHEEYAICRYCTNENGKEFVVTEKVIIPKTGHKYGEWEQVVTTDDEGKAVYNHVRTCSVCAEGTEGKIQTEACSGGKANCVERAVCATCNTAYGETDITNHKSLKVMPEKTPTCQVKGYEAYKYCEAEGCGYTETIVEIDTVDHVYPTSWTQVVTEDENGVKSYNHVKVCLTCVEDAEKNLAKSTLSEACSGGVAYCNEQATCQACKTKYGATNPANHKTQATHSMENDRVEATCTAPGKEAARLYNCCDAVKQAGAVIPQLDHEFTVELTDTKVPANCLDKGSVVYKCATCDATETRELPVDSKNHKSTEILTIGKKAATCTEKGYTGNKYHKCCYDLGKTEAQNKKALIEMGKEIPTNGTHSYSAPVPEYMIATRTESTDENGKVTVTFTYKTTEPTYAEKVAARHADGKWYHVQQCAECGDVLTKACTTYNHTINCVDHDVCDVCKGLCSLIDETSHKFELIKVPGTPATCMADGVKDYYRCGGCEKAYLDKAGKTFVDPDTDAGKAALKIDKSTAQHVINWNSPNEVVTGNCGTSGYKVFYCTVEGCDYEARLDTGVVNTIHTWPTTPDGNYVYVTITPATCGSNGYDAIRCSVCQAIKLNSYVITPATGDHNYDVNKDGKVDKNDAVIVDGEDCQSPGTITYTCTECGHKDVQTDTSGVSAHKWAEDGSDGWKVVGGDCSTGVAYERTCLVCGISEQKTETSGNHDYIEYERVEPTAERDGYVIYECKNCKFRTDPEVLKYEGNDPVDPENPDVPEIPDDPEVNKHKFNYDEYRVIEEATCQSAEIREYVCLECGEKVRLPFGEMEDHVWLKQAAEIATCERDGHSEYYRCVRCLAEDPTEPKVIYPATGHHDDDGNGKCDSCNAAFYNDGASTCDCMCHKTGFMGFIYKIVSFFWKLFKMNPSCACGNTHY